ncbi:MAG TPA: MetQ/NlpA family ABC transporter substrate-binding protein [Anaerolineaceae bacterium]|nr:MetQ/NlpA family ABC transporter substrate-binding protein [Anaerolineaceae bacterium]
MKTLRNTKKSTLSGLLALLLVCLALLSACQTVPPTAAPVAPEAAKPAETLKVKIGVTPVPHAQIINFIKDNLAAKNNLELEVVEFTDYVQPNIAVQDGQLDANFFQHLPYLKDFNAEHKTTLVSVGTVHIEPLGVYSKKIKALSELKEGDVVAIPNDATNAGRALNLLATNKLLTLKDGVGYAATVNDITANPLKLDIKELEAAQLVRSLDDTVISVINGNYALDGGLTPAKDALVLESGVDNPYANILVVREGREDDPAIQLLIKLLTSDEVKAFIEQTYSGSVIPAPAILTVKP